jgi:ribosomal protein L7/L12
MKIEIKPDGSIEINVETVAEQVILDRIYKIGQFNPLAFDKVDHGIYVAHAPENQRKPSDQISLDAIEKVLAFLKEHEKVNAVKLIKDETNLGVKESKDYVDSWQQYMGF